jgi:DNA-binding response OmpR family regulator
MESRNPGELAALARRSVRILVVNENPDEQQVLKLKLEELGAAVIQVKHGRMAIMTAQKASPDVIILDLDMTDMPGLEVLRHLKSVKRTSPVPVICLSSQRDDSFRMRALRLNADWYLTKPFRFSEMLARLRYLAQEMAVATPQTATASYEELRKSTVRSSVDTLSDVQDIRKALHGLKGYIGADDYYLNTKLEACFRGLVRIECRLKEFRGLAHARSLPPSTAARVAPYPQEAVLDPGSPSADETPRTPKPLDGESDDK